MNVISSLLKQFSLLVISCMIHRYNINTLASKLFILTRFTGSAPNHLVSS